MDFQALGKEVKDCVMNAAFLNILWLSTFRFVLTIALPESCIAKAMTLYFDMRERLKLSTLSP